MSHILDNPVWTALISGNRDLANGNDSAKYFSENVSPFAGVSETSIKSFETLYNTFPFKEPVAIFTNIKQLNTGPWTITNRVNGFQMLFSVPLSTENDTLDFTTLDERHVPEMLGLTKRTNPGPFLPKTIAFGNYEGIFKEGKLVAMAGQRLHSGNYVEISAVCTHPGFTGNGYARMLILNQIRRIQQQKEIPYLHVRADNDRAIKIYEKMGFETREEMIIYIIKKDSLA